LRLWTTPGFPVYERLFKKLRFQVVPLSATDMLTSLQTGLIEAIDVPPLFALLDRSYQIANYMTDLKWAPLNAAMVVSLDTWGKVSGDLKKDFLASAEDIVGRLRGTIRQAENQALEEMKARGLTVVALNDGERQAWRSVVDSTLSELPCQQEYPEIFEKVIRFNREYR
jgi:TRAP-type C4-dicarboxylate transport system substrate-binding protein